MKMRVSFLSKTVVQLGKSFRLAATIPSHFRTIGLRISALVLSDDHIFLHLGAFKAEDICYELGNMRGDIHGYCQRHSDTAYVACKAE